jgi:hypothetical protein
VSEQSQSGGVFGNLPRSRPGTRSPRRDSGSGSGSEGSRAAAAAEPAVEPDPREGAEAEPRQARAQSEPAVEDAEPRAPADESHGSLEDLAWAGIAAAAEAATIGVRLASRAMEAVRDAGKRT